MIEEFIKNVDKLMKLERQATFDSEQIKGWIAKLKSTVSKDIGFPSCITCPCIIYGIEPDEGCFEEDNYNEWLEDQDDDDEDERPCYCDVECQRSKYYARILKELDGEEYFNYFIDQLETLL